MEIKSLANTDFDTVFRAFGRAFADYEIQMNRVQFKTMLKRRGFNLDLSFAAFDGDEIVSFTLNGTGTFKGIPTAYDTGTGTLRDYRGKGLATKIFEYSIPYLKGAGIEQYLLEVLQHNTKAVSVYRNLGFEATREFNYFIQKNEAVEILEEVHHPVKQIDIEKLGLVPDFRDFHPSWQNGFESVGRAPEDFVCLGVFNGDELAGYCVFEPASGDITQIAVDKKQRRKGIATSLLRDAIELNRNDTVKIVNTDISCSSITGFLKAKNIEVKGTQFEMIKHL